MENQKSIEVLNSLIQINNDRVDGYNHGSKETEESDLKNLFSELSATSVKCNEELIAEVTKLGGEPTKGTTTSGKFFRIWMDVKAGLTNKDRKAILNSCEYGEDWAVKTYESVLKDNVSDLTSGQNQLVRDQYELLKKDHDELKSVRDSVTA